MNLYQYHSNPEQLKLYDKIGNIINNYGDLIFRNEKNQLHRDGDKPAAIQFSGALTWHKNGQVHRDGDKPAVIWDDGSEFYYKNSLYHRDGGKPAVIYKDGRRDAVQYWVDGERVK